MNAPANVVRRVRLYLTAGNEYELEQEAERKERDAELERNLKYKT